MWRFYKNYFVRGFQQLFEWKCIKAKASSVHEQGRSKPTCLLKTNILPCLHNVNQSVFERCSQPGWKQDGHHKEQQERETIGSSSRTEDLHQYSFLEAVGWGTVLALGWQICQPLCKLRTHDGRQKVSLDELNKSQYSSLACILTRIAWAQPGIAQHVLPAQSHLPHVDGSRNSRVTEEAPSPVTFGPITAEEALKNAVKNFEEVQSHVVGEMENRLGVDCAEQGNHTEAVSYFQRASHLRNAKAFFNLALCHELGYGVQQDLSKAAEYYTEAEKLGHATAAYNLGVYYAQGKGGLPLSEEKAELLFKKAAEAGQKEAQSVVATLTPQTSVIEDSSLNDDTHPDTVGISEGTYYITDLYDMEKEKMHIKTPSKLEVYDAYEHLQDLMKRSDSGLCQTVSSPAISHHQTSWFSSLPQSYSDVDMHESQAHKLSVLSGRSVAARPVFYIGD